MLAQQLHDDRVGLLIAGLPQGFAAEFCLQPGTQGLFQANAYGHYCRRAITWTGHMDGITHLELSDDYTAYVVRHFLRKLYTDILAEDYPQHLEFLIAKLDAADRPVAGRVPVQRLTRTEYGIAVKDLLGVEIDAAGLLPTEIKVHGFENIAAALSVSPSFLEQYVNAARIAAKLAVGEAMPKRASVKYPVAGNQGAYLDGFPLGTRGGMRFKHHFPADGEYRFNILDLDIGLYPRTLETRHTLVLLVDGREMFRQQLGGAEDLGTVDRRGADGRAAIMERFSNIPVPVKAGAHEVMPAAA